MKLRTIGMVVLRRTLELFISSIILSALAVLLNISKVAFLPKNIIVILIAADLVFFIFHLSKLKDCYYEVHSNMIYYISNFLAYGIFATTSLVLCVHNKTMISTFLFAVCKSFIYLSPDISLMESSIVFHVVMAVIITLAPMGMGWIFLANDSR